MIGLSQVVNIEDLHAEISAGYVRERTHPDDPTLRILNYTEKAQYERRWNDVTRSCRGLVYQVIDDWQVDPLVIARPWSKFFNYGEHKEGTLDMDAPVEVLDKVDGSLGIIYQGPDGWAVATRGSFESEQAIRGTEMLRELMASGRVMPPPVGWTLLAEIIYPGNRIVVDYGGISDLILLGAVHIGNGKVTGPDSWSHTWNASRADVFPAETLAEALALPPRPNAEGVVVRFVETDLMVKIKQEDYVRLHKLVTGLSERAIWEHLNEHDNIGSLLEQIPDEFHDWVLKVSEDLLNQHLDIYAVALADYNAALDRLPFAFERGEYAAIAKESRYPGLMFMLLDGKDTNAAIYKMIRSVGHRPMTNRTEDVS
jgi:RNA ligase